jgi:hypothetical protein
MTTPLRLGTAGPRLQAATVPAASTSTTPREVRGRSPRPGTGTGGRLRRLASTCLLPVLGLLLAASQAFAEPYIAVRTGLKCMQCHVNPTGGGQRNAYGNAYAQTTLAGRFITTGDAPEYWTGEINRWLAAGGDFRGSARGTSLPGAEDPPSEFAVNEVLAYLEMRLIPDVLSFNVDELIGPRGVSNRQTYALFRPRDSSVYVKAGRFFLPYGLRIEDDDAFIRQITGVNFANPDTGLEVGIDLGRWSTRFAVTNGTAGGPEVDDGKQFTAIASYVAPRWRLGASLSHDDADIGERQMAGVFAGFVTGPIAWLAEVDRIRDDSLPDGRRNLTAALLEANLALGNGHNLKLTHEFLDPDDPLQDDRTRSSLVWEYFPFQFVRGRLGFRYYDGTEGVPLQNRDEWFAQLHVYF